MLVFHFFFFQAEVGIRDRTVTGIQTCALPIFIVDLSHGVPPVATIIACALERSIGPCSRSTMIQSRPERAMICTVWMLGMVAIAPKVGRPSRHSLRRRLRVGIADVNAGSIE